MQIIINYKQPVIDTDANTNTNNILKYELHTKYILEANSKIKGGDIFDDLTDELIVQKKPKLHKDEDNYKQTISKKGSTIKVKDYKINKNMTVFDLQAVIYDLTNIPISNQHVEQKINKDYKNIQYNIENVKIFINLDSSLNNLLSFDNTKLYDIPLDINFINNRHLYVIKEFSKIRKLSDLEIEQDLEIDVFNISDFIINKEYLYNQLKNDDENMNSIYHGFVERYFAFFTLDMFKYYLQSYSLIDLYPNLHINKKDIKDKLSILNKFESIKVKNSKTINNYKNNINKLNIKIESYQTTKSILLQDVFNVIELSKFSNIHKIECRININDKIVYLEKINMIDTKYHTTKLILEKNKIDFNCILLLITINNKKFKLIDNTIEVIIDEFNNIYLTFYPNEIFKLEEYKTVIEIELNKIILKLNKVLNLGLTVINKYNIKIMSIDADLTLNNNILKISYQDLLKIIQNNIHLNYYKILESDEISNKLDLKLKYCDIKSNINENKLNSLSDNYFNFNLDPVLITKYEFAVYLSKVMLQIRVEDIKINFININMNEYEYINEFFIKLLTSQNIKKEKTNINLLNANKIKILKETDPNLYIINKSNSKNLYSRKCQSSKQPIIVNGKDIKSKKNVVKYWNFTKHKPEYYSCENKKYPYIKFLTGIHPNNYCIPCCKKKAADDVKIHSSYQNIHNTCMSKFTYAKNEETVEVKSRYIINYSCKFVLDSERLMEIPTTLKKIFNCKYEINDNKNETAKDCNTTYYIKGINQSSVNVKNIGILHILSQIMNKNLFDTINIINKFLMENSNIINNLLNGKILNYVSNIKDLIKLINKTFLNNIELQDFIVFELWNEFFIDISKYLGYVYIIIDEEDIDATNDSKLKLLITDNIKNSSEYIGNNNSYQYIIICRRYIDNNVYYYPILKLNYKEYYHDNSLYKISFKYDDSIILKLKNIVKTSLDQIKIKNNISLDQIDNFILFNDKYKIVKYFINKNKIIYSVLIQINKREEYIYINIDNKHISDISFKDTLKLKLYSYDPINIQKYNLRYKNVLLFIKEMNEYIFYQNKYYYSDSFYKLYINNLIKNNIKNTNKYLNMGENEIYEVIENDTKLNKNNNKNYKYLRIQSYIINKNNKNENSKIIGVVCNNLNIYINDNFQTAQCIKHIEDKYNNIINILSKNKIKKNNIEEILTRELSLEKNDYKFYIPDINEISNFIDYKNYFKIYLYNPNEINKIINNQDIIPDNRISNINNAIYQTNLYNLLVLHIVSIIKKVKNVNLRNKIKLIISNFNKDDIYTIENSKSNKKLYDIINTSLIKKNDNKIADINDKTESQTYGMYSNIIILFRNVIILNKSQSSQKIKELLLNILDNTRFAFDDLYLYDLLKLNKKEFIYKINKVLDNVLIFKKVNSNQNIIDLTLCNGTNKSYYCDKNKLIIDRNIYNTMIDIFYYDITNPFKQRLLLNFININNDLYKFNNHINEKIFIYY